MPLRLIKDVVWRSRAAYGLFAAVIATIWAVVAGGYMPVYTGFMVSLLAAEAMGPRVAMLGNSMRELRLLPVTNRQSWMAMWTVATVIVTTFVLTVSTLAVVTVSLTTGSAAVQPETLILCAVYVFAFAGMALPMGPGIGYFCNAFGNRQPAWFWTTLVVGGVLVALTAGMVAPFLIARWLPTTLSEFTPVASVLLGAAVTMAFASLAWTPRRGPMARPGTSTHRTTTPVAAARPARAGGPTGLWQFAWRQTWTSAASLLAFAALMVGIDSVTLGVLPEGPATPWYEVLSDSTFLVVSIATASRFSLSPRHLKVLPLGVHQINALLLVTAIATTLWIGALLVGLHAALGLTFPAVFVWQGLCCAAGVMALAEAMKVRSGASAPSLQGFSTSLLAILPLSFVFKTVANGTTATERLMLIAGTVLALIAAALLNHRTFTRSGSRDKVYQRPVSPFGLPADG